MHFHLIPKWEKTNLGQMADSLMVKPVAFMGPSRDQGKECRAEIKIRWCEVRFLFIPSRIHLLSSFNHVKEGRKVFVPSVHVSYFFGNWAQSSNNSGFPLSVWSCCKCLVWSLFCLITTPSLRAVGLFSSSSYPSYAFRDWYQDR